MQSQVVTFHRNVTVAPHYGPSWGSLQHPQTLWLDLSETLRSGKGKKGMSEGGRGKKVEIKMGKK